VATVRGEAMILIANGSAWPRAGSRKHTPFGGGDVFALLRMEQ